MALSQRLFFCGLILFSQTLFAGGWVSSGGLLLKDIHNPWFFDKNASTIHYCVEIDQNTISAPPQVVNQQITRSLNFWKNEFQKSLTLTPRNISGHFSIGHQDFVKTDCQATNIDIKFKFGYATLEEDEKKFLKDHRKYVGVTVRQSYDKKRLRAKGFIYIASDRGSNAYHNPGDLVEKAWKNSDLLYLAITHELGHVFGISHTGNGLMSESFLDQLLKKKLTDSYLLAAPYVGFLVPSDIKLCGDQAKGLKKYFGLKPKEQCLGFNFLLHKKEITVMGLLNRQESFQMGRTAGKILGIDFVLGGMRIMPTNYIHLPAEQDIFKPDDLKGFGTFLVGPPRVETSAKGRFVRFNDFSEHELQLEISPSFFRIMGQINGHLRNILLVNSPITIGIYLSGMDF